MSIYNYKKKTKPALWTTTPSAAEQIELLNAARRMKKDAGAALKRTRALKAKRVRDLDRMARGLRKVKPSRTPKQKAGVAAKAAYRKRVKDWLVGKQCVGCLHAALVFDDDGRRVKMATQCHHKHGRGHRGELLLVEELWLPVCAACHTWIHQHIADARALGLYAPVGQWNERPKVL